MPFVMEMHWPEIGVDEYEEVGRLPGGATRRTRDG